MKKIKLCVIAMLSIVFNVFGEEASSNLFVFKVPAQAELFLGTKSAHFVKFTEVLADSSKVIDNQRNYYFNKLTQRQVYNFRVSQPGKIVNGGYFTMDPSVMTSLEVTEDDMNIAAPDFIDTDVHSNSGYNVADILLNINESGNLKLKSGDEYQLMAFRNWQTIETVINNYAIDPDFHYSVINLDGKPDNSVVTIDENNLLKAVGKGSAIVLVTYDAINLYYYSKATRTAFVGGSVWSAIAPENTGAFVVSVDEAESSVVSNLTIHQGKNTTTSKLSGDAIDAEHDVFYYLQNTDGYLFNFTPQNVASVEIANAVIGEKSATYNEFKKIDTNADGSYTLLLTQGRNIVKMTDNNGASSFQILTAKPTNYVIENLTNPESPIMPGDKFAVHFAGLYHPSNKLSGIYNMSTKIDYYTLPEGCTATGKANQYLFASSAEAQTISSEIPANWDCHQPFVMQNGSLLLSGFGDPIGNHRATSPITGRMPNFAASVRTAWFGSLPDIAINVCSPFDYNALWAAIELATSKIQNDYTEQSWQNLQNALTEARQVELIPTNTVSQTQIDEATLSLEMAIENLQIVEPIEEPIPSTKISENPNLLVYAYANTIVVANAQSAISVFDISGRLISQHSADAVVSINIVCGAYFVKVDNQIFKLILN